MRKENSIKNFITSAAPFVILVFLGFWKVNVWQKTFSEDVYALNQLFFQIFAYLSLAEAGIGAIVQKEYYKLFIDNDKDTIRIFYTLSKKMLRNVCYIIAIASFAVSFFLPHLAKNNLLSASYMQNVFLLFVFKSLVEYMLFSPRFVIQADQKLYKINIQMNIYKILEAVLEVALVMYGLSYEMVLFITLIVRVIMNLRVNKIVFKEYPWLKPVEDTGDFKIQGMSHILIYKLVSVVYENVDVLLISTFVNPISVIIYSNYKYITKYISDMMYMVGNAIVSSLGNLLYSKEDAEQVYYKYEMINTLFYFLACVLTIALGYCINSFVAIWVGPKKVFDYTSFACVLFLLFHTIVRRPQYILKDIFVLYKDLQLVSIVETALNIILSLMLVKRWGIKGVLIATVMATTLTNLWYFPVYLYKKVFKKKPWHDMLKYGACGLLVVVVLGFSFWKLPRIPSQSYIAWFFGSCIYSLLVFIVVAGVFWFSFKSFRKLCKELKEMFLRGWVNR